MAKNASAVKNPLQKPFLLLTVAMLLLANPIWCVTDLLPDTFAWIAVVFALRLLAEQETNFYHARRNAFWLLLVSCVRVALWFPLRGTEVESNRMLAVMLFGVVEGWLLWRFFRDLLTGIETNSRDASDPAVYESVGNMRFLCGLFLITRTLCYVIPELTAIPALRVQSDQQLDLDLLHLLQELASLHDLLLAVMTVICLIIAVVWLVQFLPYLRRLSKDSALQTLYADRILAPTAKNIRLRSFAKLRMARICFTVGLVFPWDLRIESVRVLPFGMFPACFFVGILLLNSFSEKTKMKKSLALSGVSAVVLLASEVYRYCGTIWDAPVYAEVFLPSELISAVWMFVSACLLFAFWQVFSREMDALSFAHGCKELYLHRASYVQLCLLFLMHTAVFLLPFWNNYLALLRVLLVAAFWQTANRTLAVFEERITDAIRLEPVS